MSLSLTLAIAASVLIGSSEALVGQFVRSNRSEVVTATFFLVGVLVMALLLMVVPSEWRTGDVLLGGISGFFNGLALILLYRSYELIPVGLGSPMVGVQSAAWPVVFAVVIGGEVLGWLTTVGILLGVVALVLVSFDPQPSPDMKRGLALALSAGALFGIMITLIVKTSEASGIWPMVPQRAVAFGVAAIFAKRTGPNVLPVPGSRLKILSIGTLGSLGAAAYIVAAQKGSVSEVAVAGAQFPAVAVALSYVLFRVKIRWWQVVGLLASLVAVSLIAIG